MINNNNNSKMQLGMVNLSYEPDDESDQRTSGLKKSIGKGISADIDGSNSIYLDDDDDEYHPYENRVVEKPTSNNETLVHLLKGSLGTGILAMPNAFSHSGFVVGVIGTLAIGITCTYCIHMIVNTGYELCRRKRVPSMTYPAMAIAGLEEGPAWCKAVAPYSGIVVNVFLLIYQIGTCCVYVVFISENLKRVIDVYVDNGINLKICMTATLLPLILINWVRNLKVLAPFSQVANVTTIASFGVILYYIFREPLSMEGKHATGPIGEFPLFFGTVLFALEAIGVILPLENEMKTPQYFGGRFGVLNKSMLVIILLYVMMGLFGYLKYGHGTLGSITLNLPSVEEAAQFAQILLAFSIYITHGLACYVAIDIAWAQYMRSSFKDHKYVLVYEYIVRTVIVLITFTLAISIPALDLFISLFGALCLSALGLAFPAIIQSSTYWYHIPASSRNLMTAKNVILVCIGIAGLISGTYISLSEIVREFS